MSLRLPPLILAAMQMEARAVEKALAGLQFEIELIGIAAKRIPILTGRKNSCVIMAGLCGALDPALKIGDVILDSASDSFPPNLPAIKVAGIHSVREIVATTAEKARLFRQTGAAGVDMENAIVRAAAKEAGLPFIGIRAVSDTSEQPIDPEVLKLCDDIGRPKPLAAAAFVMKHPGRIASLRQLQAQSATACAALGRGVRAVIEAINLG